MSVITFKQKGAFRKTTNFLEKIKQHDFLSGLDAYGQRGVDALAAATPIDSGNTAASWTYSIEKSKRGATIFWSNSNVNAGVNIAVILQYGHGTGTGGWVEGRNYINPSIQPIFDEIAENAWKEVAG